ncbi:MAG: ArsR/SmtB family transcription factor [Patescibacteria group bacterium]
MKCCAPGSLEDKNIVSLADELAVLAEPNRLRILCLLKKGERCVCDIFQALDLPQNLTSHHLKMLRDAEFLTSRREGTRIIYARNERVIKKFHRLLTNSIPL